MFMDKGEVSADDFIVMMYLLNSAEDPFVGTLISEVRAKVAIVLRSTAFNDCIERLVENHLAKVFDPGESPRFEIKFTETECVCLTYSGVAFLVNYAEEYLKRVDDEYGEIPDRLLKTLIPYLELRSIPAADRYVSTTDNRSAFDQLTESLEAIRLEILKDQNKNELPIKQKRGVISELDGMLAQLKGGFVKLSDLTSRIRPLMKNLAETCKDFTIIAGAASAAYLAITQILGKLF
jgi:hypothetical protein